MATPSKQQIIEKALELYAKDQWRHGCPELAETSPEINELAEGGYLQSARSELMYSTATKYEAQWSSYSESMENFEEFSFDVKEAMATTSFVCGARGVGKSDVAMEIADKLSDDGVICVAIDCSRDWLKRSSIREYLTVTPDSDMPIPERNVIFDLSTLTPMQQQKTVENFNKKLFEHQVFSNSKKRYCLIFEESQIYFPLNALRSKRCQNSMRLLTAGRNFEISVCAISQFTATVDKELIKNSGQIYIGMTSEKNAVDYWENGMLGNRAKELKELQNGQFLYYNRNKISKIEIESYANTTAKTQIVHNAAPTPQPQPITLQPKLDYTPLLRVAVIGFIGALIILTGLL
jgi:hypothetical protein